MAKKLTKKLIREIVGDRWGLEDYEVRESLRKYPLPEKVEKLLDAVDSAEAEMENAEAEYHIELSRLEKELGL